MFRMGAIVLAALLLGPPTAAAQDDGQSSPGGSVPQEPAATPVAQVLLADATPEESEALNRLATSRAWTSRALAAMRLERFDCEASAGRLLSLTGDASWRVRAYAFACLARRGVPIAAEALESERDPRVLRAIVRGRYTLRQPTLDARIAALERSGRPADAALALEILAALGRADDKAIRERMDELLRVVIVRMDRTEAGTLSARLAAITAAQDFGREHRWREWFRKARRDLGFREAALVPSAPAGVRLVAANKVATLSPADFIAFEGYLASVADRPMDLAILIDCTASMWRELSDAQSSITDLVDFLGSVTGGVRIAIVGYRDRTDAWEMRAWDFTPSVTEAERRLWALSAEGGGDEPESVYSAMRQALSKFSWLPDARPPAPQPIRALVLVGDAPPHPGEGTLCIDLARRAFANGVRTYGIVARDKEANLKEEGSERAPLPSREKDAGGDGAKDAAPDAPKDGEGARGRNGRTPIAPPKALIPEMRKRPSHTWFPEIADAGGGRAEILREGASLAAEIAELTIADRHRAEFGDFFAAFRLLCR
ncbi:MAG: hypothetical protein GC172_04475 [Phycisphaera sp.]|nr:hypothetical protein [Phycisphaera sp.]